MKRVMAWINVWTTWFKTHPATAALCFSGLMGILVASVFTDESWFRVWAALYVALAITVGFIVWKQTRTILSLFLALTFLPSRVQAEEKGGHGGGGCVAVVVGVVVLVAGGFALYKLTKFCQRKFPKDPPKNTNAPPEELVLESGDSEAASFNIGNIGSCFCEDLGGSGGGGPDPTTTFSLSLHVGASAEPGEASLTPLSMTVRQGPEAVQDWKEYAAEIKQLGVTATGIAGDFSYARNGQPVAAADSSIQWDAQRGVVKIAKGSAVYYTVVIERSPDLKTWIPLLKTEVEVGSVLNVVDTNPSSQHFYRYRGFISD